MNNRWSKRTPIKLHVVLHYSPLGLVMGKVRDICTHGMFVETGMVTLPPNETISISFIDPLSEKRHVVNIDADVRHVEYNGVGIRFKDFVLQYSDDPAGQLVIPVYH